MMDLTCSLQSLSRQSRHLKISLIFLLTVACQLTVIETTKRSIPLSGEIGGEVTFPCIPTKKKSISYFYLQKGNNFVNGYYISREITTQKWENTRTDKENNVHMFHLNASHAGEYTCYFQYADTSLEEIHIQLSVTATYTKPNVTVSCSDTDHNCKVTCIAHGGYPKNKILWDVHSLGNASSQMWKVVENPPECDAKTKLCNISSTASFNCSFGQRSGLVCYVDGTGISSFFSICETVPPPPPGSLAVPIAAGAVVIFSILGVLLLWKIRKGQRGSRNERMTQEPNVEEGVSLRE